MPHTAKLGPDPAKREWDIVARADDWVMPRVGTQHHHVSENIPDWALAQSRNRRTVSGPFEPLVLLQGGLGGAQTVSEGGRGTFDGF